MQRRRLLQSSLGLLAAAPFAGARAQSPWPNKPIRYVVPFAAGGTTDILARLLSPKIGNVLGQTFVIDNKAGAGGVLGADMVAKAPPDGYTILGSTISTQAINPVLNPKIPYNAAKDFAPVTMIGTTSNAVVVPASSPFKTIQDLISYARANPGRLSFSSAGTGSSQHMGGELLKQMAGMFIVHIPYRGSGPAVQDVIAGQVNFGIDTLVATAAHIKAGTLRVLAVTAGKRVKGFESVPTIAESGVKGYDVVSWQTVHAPAGTPKEIVARLHAEIASALAQPDIRQRLDALGLEPSGMKPEELAAFEIKEREKWAKVVKEGGIKVE
ncbi:tripartite tricarboxylate transporter substrate binding protein [Aquincola sp. S2]|uniref:Tripartite tricarboxylate transporter substrate binding protein n=1 Tax=Pseudaquabacterium terrae TaxID=2732868 RepID=A0ABX2EEC1_9BURK|nr:tripartite tricarboxylate transporter substrate binding protein [Aquabacterium terrae]NRF66965.1 tripartite tricarboxylate transporter substrate binding protein [Aquabacterium terrae]